MTLGQNPNSTGRMAVYQIDGSSLKTVYEMKHNVGLKSGTFDASIDGTQLVTSDYDGNVSIWDMNNLSSGPIWNVKGHKGLINKVDGCGGLVGKGAPEIVTAGQDGCVRVWDPRQKDAVLSLEPVAGEDNVDCWTAAFGNSHTDNDRALVAGYDNGDVKMFDLRAKRLLWETNVKNGVVDVSFDRKEILMNKLSVSTIEGHVHMFDMRTYHTEHGFSGKDNKVCQGTIWGSHFLPQNREIFGVAGGSGTLSLFKYNYPDQRQIKDEDGILTGVVGEIELLNDQVVAQQPIVGLDWNTSKLGLACVASLDQCVRVIICTRLNQY